MINLPFLKSIKNKHLGFALLFCVGALITTMFPWIAIAVFGGAAGCIAYEIVARLNKEK